MFATEIKWGQVLFNDQYFVQSCSVFEEVFRGHLLSTGYPGKQRPPRSQTDHFRVPKTPTFNLGLMQKPWGNSEMAYNKDFRGSQRQFSENICSEDDLRSRIFGTLVVKFLACLLLLSLRNADVFPVIASLPPKMVFGATTGNTSALHRLASPKIFEMNWKMV